MLPCWQLIKKCIAKKIRPACIAEKQHISMHSRMRIKLKALLITLIWLTPLQTNPFLTSFNMFFMYQETNTIIIQSMLACLLLWQTVFACKKGIKLVVSHAKIWRIRYINIEKRNWKISNYTTILGYTWGKYAYFYNTYSLPFHTKFLLWIVCIASSCGKTPTN